MPTAPDSVWDTYIRSHPAAEKFRIHGIANYSILHELCANMTATGEFALTTNLTFPGQPEKSCLGGLGGEMLPAGGRVDKEKENGKLGRVNNKKLEAIGQQKEDLDGKEGNGKDERTDGPRWHEVNGSAVGGLGDGQCEWEGEEEKDKAPDQVDRASQQGSEEGNRDLEGRAKRSFGGVGEKERKKAKLSVFKLEKEDEKYSNGYEGEQRTQQASRRERKSAGKAIAQALDRMSATAQSIQKTKTEEAVEKLQKEYRSKSTV